MTVRCKLVVDRLQDGTGVDGKSTGDSIERSDRVEVGEVED